MKSTGVVRRIDDLGRIVIPKEIRRTLKINEGDSLEIYVNNSEIVLSKYSIIDSIVDLSNKLVDSFYKTFKKTILVTDKEKVIASPKANEKEYLGFSLISTIKDSISNRSVISFKNSDIVSSGRSENSFFLFPIIVNSDVVGSIILINDECDTNLMDVIKLLLTILIKNIEE